MLLCFWWGSIVFGISLCCTSRDLHAGPVANKVVAFGRAEVVDVERRSLQFFFRDLVRPHVGMMWNMMLHKCRMCHIMQKKTRTTSSRLHHVPHGCRGLQRIPAWRTVPVAVCKSLYTPVSTRNLNTIVARGTACGNGIANSYGVSHNLKPVLPLQNSNACMLLPPAQSLTNSHHALHPAAVPGHSRSCNQSDGRAPCL